MATVLLELPIVAGDRRGDVLQMECGMDTTFEQVDEFLRGQTPNWRFKVFLGERGSCILSGIASKRLSDLLYPAQPLPVLPLVDKYGVPFGDIMLAVQTMSNGTYNVMASTSDKIGSLKMLLEYSSGLDAEPMRLLLHGQPLDDQQTVGDYDLKDLTELDLVPRMHGGGLESGVTFRFVDVSNVGARRDLPWSKTAPKWRKAARGFALEGVCETSSCEAKGKMVISNMGFGVFDLARVKPNCPLCKNEVEKKNLGFNNCFYMMRGAKANSFVEMSDMRSPWIKVGDLYRTWNRRQAGMVAWIRLEISVRQLERARTVPGDAKREAPLGQECPICTESMGTRQDCRMLSCSHSFHRTCWEAWEQRVQSKGLAVTCPMCREWV